MNGSTLRNLASIPVCGRRAACRSFRPRLIALGCLPFLIVCAAAQAAADGLYSGEDLPEVPAAQSSAAPGEYSDTPLPGVAEFERPGGTTAPVQSAFVPQILAAARATDVEPALIHAIISVESGYNPLARSRGGALGLMQLMPGTARRYGVVNRLDPEQNIQGGARYLRDLMALFDNDLQLVLAAYNAGEEAVVRYGRRIPPFRTTMAFVARVMDRYRQFREVQATGLRPGS